MEEIIIKDKEYIILSSTVTNATRCKIVDVEPDNFKIKLRTDENYKKGEQVTFFATVGSGVIYFNSKILEIDGDIILIKKPAEHTIIQRREYTRAETDKKILLIDGNHNIRSTIKDISAGGMRIITQEKLIKNKTYRADINLEKNISVSCGFKPIRIDLREDKTYNISGRFSLIKNLDRVALVQFCFRKEQEKENKNK